MAHRHSVDEDADADGNQGDHEHENAVASRQAHFVLPQHGLVVALELANERDDKAAVNGGHREEDAPHPEAEVCNVLQKPRVVHEALGGFVHVNVDQGHEGGEEQRAGDAEGRVLVQQLALRITFDGVELVEAL